MSVFLKPRQYIGIDIEKGRFVDVVLPAEKVVEYFGEESFDIVLSTELLEHVKDWRLVVNNMKKVLKPGGVIMITTRSEGFPYHGYPHDYWRYSVDDMRKIFADFQIKALKKDPEAPGVFIKAVKPWEWNPVPLEDIALYSMILGKRTKTIPTIEQMPITRRAKLALKQKAYNLKSKLSWAITLK